MTLSSLFFFISVTISILSLLKIHQTPLPGFLDAFIKSAPALLGGLCLKIVVPTFRQTGSSP